MARPVRTVSVRSRRLGRRLRKRIERDRLGQQIVAGTKRAVCAIAPMRRVLSAKLPRVSGVGGLALACVLVFAGVKLWEMQRGTPPSTAGAWVSPGPAPSAPPPATLPVANVTVARAAPQVALPSTRQAIEPQRRMTPRQRCLARLYQTGEYRAAKAEADRLQERVRMLRVSDPRNELKAASVQWIEAKSVLGRLAEAALQADPEVARMETTLKTKDLRH